MLKLHDGQNSNYEMFKALNSLEEVFAVPGVDADTLLAEVRPVDRNLILGSVLKPSTHPLAGEETGACGQEVGRVRV